MKKLWMAVLITSIAMTIFAQSERSGSDKVFDLPNDFAHRRFSVDLGNGNTMQIELKDVEDLRRIVNMDSIISQLLNDLEPFKDKLADELPAKRIDYILNSKDLKKLRIQQFNPKGSSFTIVDGSPSLLKLEQDTVNLIGKVVFRAKYTLRKAFTDTRDYRVRFFLNNYTDLSLYADGRLNAKVKRLVTDLSSPWKFTAPNHAVLKADPTISARQPKGYVAGSDYLNIRVSVDAQNYKSYFIPSFTVGAGIILTTDGFFKREIMASWEPNFLFAKNSQGQLKTFRNDFIGLSWGQGAIKDQEPHLESHLLFVASLAYLVHREGDFIEKNTFRLGAGRISLFEGKTKIEPVIYFNNFFKGVTPGLRWIQSF